MNYGKIKPCDVANGEGVRVSVFVSGCPHKCKGCFNPELWNYNAGQKFTCDVIDEILNLCSKDYITGLSLLGGEPLAPENFMTVAYLCHAFKRWFPNKTIWCYTGYMYDTDLSAGGKAYCECTDELLSLLDILVDGEFVEALKDITLVFRGSSNQRVIDVQKTLQNGQVCLYPVKK